MAIGQFRAGGRPALEELRQLGEFDELRRVAEDAGRRWPVLAPNGGCRWTVEDQAIAESLLIEATESGAFHRALDRGMTPPKRHFYLLKCLYRRLLKDRMRERRVPLLDPQAIDDIVTEERMPALLPEEILLLARRISQRLGSREMTLLLALVGGNAHAPMAPRTLARCRARIRGVLLAVKEEAGISLLDLMVVTEVLPAVAPSAPSAD